MLHHCEEFFVIQISSVHAINDKVVAIFIIVDWEMHIALSVHKVHVTVLVNMLDQVVAL